MIEEKKKVVIEFNKSIEKNSYYNMHIKLDDDQIFNFDIIYDDKENLFIVKNILTNANNELLSSSCIKFEYFTECYGTKFLETFIKFLLIKHNLKNITNDKVLSDIANCDNTFYYKDFFYEESENNNFTFSKESEYNSRIYLNFNFNDTDNIEYISHEDRVNMLIIGLKKILEYIENKSKEENKLNSEEENDNSNDSVENNEDIFDMIGGKVILNDSDVIIEYRNNDSVYFKLIIPHEYINDNNNVENSPNTIVISTINDDVIKIRFKSEDDFIKFTNKLEESIYW